MQGGTICRNLAISPIVLLIFVATELICVFQDKFLSINNLKIFNEVFTFETNLIVVFIVHIRNLIPVDENVQEAPQTTRPSYAYAVENFFVTDSPGWSVHMEIIPSRLPSSR